MGIDPNCTDDMDNSERKCERKLVRLVENPPLHFRHSNRSAGKVADWRMHGNGGTMGIMYQITPGLSAWTTERLMPTQQQTPRTITSKARTVVLFPIKDLLTSMATHGRPPESAFSASEKWN
jgi:hypothetical protein